jgi:hypothetical protein
MNEKQIELAETLNVLDKIMEKARCGRSVFLQEIRAFDIDCRATLTRALPSYPHLTDGWLPTPETTINMGTLEDVINRLEPMRITLLKAISIAS